MSITTVIADLEDLVKIHHNLIEVSKEKTVTVTEGQVDEFQKLLLKERKFILSLEQAERKRHEAVEKWFVSQNIVAEEKTITRMLELIKDEQDQMSLATVTTNLAEAITTLKNQEQLNRELIEQSMQFVQMSLNMLSPSIDQMNYGEKKQSQQSDRSVFDSKA